MPHVGQVIDGSEGVRATVTRADRDAYEVEFVYPPGSAGRLGPHLHTRQTESFEVLDGRARYVLDGAEKEAGPGDRLVVPPGAAHVNPWNVGTTDLRVRQWVEPALDFHLVIETLLGLARDGRLGPGGQVPFLALAALGDGVQSKSYRPGPPIGVQAALFKLFRWVGWPLGYRARYARYSGTA